MRKNRLSSFKPFSLRKGANYSSRNILQKHKQIVSTKPHAFIDVKNDKDSDDDDNSEEDDDKSNTENDDGKSDTENDDDKGDDDDEMDDMVENSNDDKGGNDNDNINQGYFVLPVLRRSQLFCQPHVQLEFFNG